jgi:hypothetical protein
VAGGDVGEGVTGVGVFVAGKIADGNGEAVFVAGTIAVGVIVAVGVAVGGVR